MRENKRKETNNTPAHPLFFKTSSCHTPAIARQLHSAIDHGGAGRYNID